MTRLKNEDIDNLSATLEDYNHELVVKTGYNLSQIAAHAVGIEEKKFNWQAVKVAVIPMTCGQGVITGFAQAVASIAGFLGCRAFVTKSPDAGGFAEAVELEADVLMMADDNRFVAVNLATRKVADNGEATGKGYAAALDLMSGGLKNKNVLLVGAGPVGIGAASALVRFGSKLSVYDINPVASLHLASLLALDHGYQVKVESELDSALLGQQLIIDACPTPAFIEKRHINDQTIIAAPGIPLGVDAECFAQMSRRILHDPLQIGVATMIFEVMGGEES